MKMLLNYLVDQQIRHSSENQVSDSDSIPINETVENLKKYAKTCKINCDTCKHRVACGMKKQFKSLEFCSNYNKDSTLEKLESSSEEDSQTAALN